MNIVALDLEPGTYRFESIEPYTMRYLKPLVLAGDCTLSNVHLREYVNPEAWNAIQRKWYANRKRGVHAERIVGALHDLGCRMPRYCSCQRIVLVRP